MSAHRKPALGETAYTILVGIECGDDVLDGPLY